MASIFFVVLTLSASGKLPCPQISWSRLTHFQNSPVVKFVDAEACLCSQHGRNSHCVEGEIDVCECNQGFEPEDASNYFCKGNYACGFFASSIHLYTHIAAGMTDINECALSMDDCVHKCKNIDGGFQCSCELKFQGDGKKSGTGCSGEQLSWQLRQCPFLTHNVPRCPLRVCSSTRARALSFIIVPAFGAIIIAVCVHDRAARPWMLTDKDECEDSSPCGDGGACVNIIVKQKSDQAYKCECFPGFQTFLDIACSGEPLWDMMTQHRKTVRVLA